MSSKIFTSKFRVINTPLKASDLLVDEVIIATDAEEGTLFTHMQEGKETLYDSEDNPPEDSVPICFPPYKEL